MTTTEVSQHANGARSQRNRRGPRGSTSADNGSTTAAPTPIDDTYAAHLTNQSPWASVLLNPQRPAGPGPDPEAWRANAEEVRGTWWDHWADWIFARSGAEVPAPTSLGSDTYPCLQPAPGSHVRNSAAHA